MSVSVRAGLVLEETAGSNGTSLLTLRDPGRRTLTAELNRQRTTASWPASSDTASWPVVLRRFLAQRALLPAGRFRGHVTGIRLRNRGAKTVVRLDVQVPGKVEVRPVLGYDRAFDNAKSFLTEKCGLAVRNGAAVTRPGGEGPASIDPADGAGAAAMAVCRGSRHRRSADPGALG